MKKKPTAQFLNGNDVEVGGATPNVDENDWEKGAPSSFYDLTRLAKEAAEAAKGTKEVKEPKKTAKIKGAPETESATGRDERGFVGRAAAVLEEDAVPASPKSDFSPNWEWQNRSEPPERSEEPRFFSPEEIVDEILLSTVDGVGPLTIERLIAFFGSAAEALRASRADLERVEKVGPAIAKKIAAARDACDVESLIRFCRENGIEIVSIRDSRYPERLREIANPPRLLYVRGEILPVDRTAIAVVGTRAVSQYGAEQTTRLSRELVAAGFTVVSGLALGVDGAAHRTALAAGGRTLAVLGCGVAKVYPREHAELARRVAESGAVLSEYHPLASPLAGNFPSRNRIVSGLALGVMVVEAPTKSGSLITARIAAEQNREVFAVPGPVGRPNSGGCHQLLREGAALVETVDDVLDALSPFVRPREAAARRPAARRFSEKTLKNSLENVAKKSASPNSSNLPNSPIPTNLSDDERRVVAKLDANPKSIDALVQESGLPASKIVGLIAALEFKKVVRRREGNAVSLR